MASLVPGFVVLYAGERVRELRYGDPEDRGGELAVVVTDKGGKISVRVHHAELLTEVAFSGLQKILEHVSLHGELPGREEGPKRPEWLPEAPEGWEWRLKGKVRLGGKGLGDWALGSKVSNQVTSWNRRQGSWEWFLSAGSVPLHVIEVMTKTFSAYERAHLYPTDSYGREIGTGDWVKVISRGKEYGVENGAQGSVVAIEESKVKVDLRAWDKRVVVEPVDLEVVLR